MQGLLQAEIPLPQYVSRVPAMEERTRRHDGKEGAVRIHDQRSQQAEVLEESEAREETEVCMMADIEKVIRGLKRCSEGTCPSIFSKEYEECEYTDGLYCRRDRLIAETIELLKEKEPLPAELEGGGSTWWYVCGDCHGAINDSDKYCRHCGRRLKRA